MKKCGNVYYYHSHNGLNADKYFKSKIIIILTIFPNPEKVWPNNKEMIDGHHKINDALIKLGILNQETLHKLKYIDRYITIAAEFLNLTSAKKAFRSAIKMGIVDIYLYENNHLVDKFD